MVRLKKTELDKEVVKRSDIAELIAESEGISKTAADRIISQIFNHLTYMMVEKQIIRIKGFAAFSCYYRTPRKGSHPVTREPIEIGDSVNIKIKTSSTAKRLFKKYIDRFRPDNS